MTSRKKFILLFLPLMLSACITVPPEEDPVLRKLTELETRLIKVERVLDNQSLLEIAGQLDQMQREQRELRGAVETIRHDLDGAGKRERDRYVQLDDRLAKLESGAPAAGYAPAFGSDSGGEGLPAIGSTGAPGDQPASTQAGLPPAPADGSDAAAYDAAFSLLKQGRYDDAGKGFAALLAAWPGSSYADNSQYWLAESMYVRRQFAKAETEFRTVVQRYPRSGKVADALLKIGYCNYELQDWGEARAALEQVVATSPDSSAARLAAQRLDRMRREGR